MAKENGIYTSSVGEAPKKYGESPMTAILPDMCMMRDLQSVIAAADLVPPPYIRANPNLRIEPKPSERTVAFHAGRNMGKTLAVDLARGEDMTVGMMISRDARRLGEVHHVVGLDEQIISSLTTATEEQPTTLTLDHINNALRVLNETDVMPSERPMTATEVRLRMLEHQQNFFNEYGAEVMRSFIGSSILRDLATYGVGATVFKTEKPKRPDPATTLQACAWMPKTIKRGAFTAHLLDDEGKIFDESETMRHCLFRLYTNRIINGVYVGYHIDQPEGWKKFEHGFTATFELKEVLRWERAGDADPKKPTTYTRCCVTEYEWLADQVQGKARSFSKDGALQLFVDHIAHTLNNADRARRGVGSVGEKGPKGP